MAWFNLYSLLGIVLVFGALVFFHELGHFLLAKRAGILCREFALGFGPKLLAFKKGETLYTLRLFPLGGFVRMAGEDPELVEVKTGQAIRILTNERGEVTHLILDHSYPQRGEKVVVQKVDLVQDLVLVAADEAGAERHYRIHPQAQLVQKGMETQIAPWNRQFGSKSLSQRFWAIIAGPLFNFLLAAVLFSVFALINGVPMQEPIVERVVPDSPAAKAGIQPKDKIIQIGDQAISTWAEFQERIQASPNEPVRLVVERNQEQYQTTVTPGERIFIRQIEGEQELSLFPGEEIEQINGVPVTSLQQAEEILAQHIGKEITLTVPKMEQGELVSREITVDLASVKLQLDHVGVIGVYQARDHSIGTALLQGPKETLYWTALTFQGLAQIFTSSDGLNQVGGPVAIFKITGDAANQGISPLIKLAGILSLNLGIFNLLPIPALDGGRLVFLGIEAIRGRPVDQSKESLVHFIGFAFLMLLIVLVTWNDIQRLF